jgi:hypothetical protein
MRPPDRPGEQAHLLGMPYAAVNGDGGIIGLDWRPMWSAEPSFTNEALETIVAPTLLIIGDRGIVTPEHAVEMFRAIPGAQLSVIPNAGHGVMPAETVLAFLVGEQAASVRQHCDLPSPKCCDLFRPRRKDDRGTRGIPLGGPGHPDLVHGDHRRLDDRRRRLRCDHRTRHLGQRSPRARARRPAGASSWSGVRSPTPGGASPARC